MNKVGVLIYCEKSLVLGPNDEDIICIDGQQENASFVNGSESRFWWATRIWIAISNLVLTFEENGIKIIWNSKKFITEIFKQILKICSITEKQQNLRKIEQRNVKNNRRIENGNDITRER